MYGTQFIDTSSNHCIRFFGNTVNLDWTSLIWAGLLVLLFEITIYVALRLKYIYIPPRFMIAVLIVTAILLAEGLPYVFLQLEHFC